MNKLTNDANLCRDRQPHPLTRRQWLQRGANGFGYTALAAMMAQQAQQAQGASAATPEEPKGYVSPTAPRAPHFAPRAKRVIFMFMQGGPPQTDTFDFKPQLIRDASKSTAPKGKKKKKGGRKLLAPAYKFKRFGESGLPIAEVFPNIGAHADDMCLINGMHTDNPAHPQATVMMHTGSINFVRPSVGAWVLYGLGTVNQNLPGFVALDPLTRLGGAQNYGSAFLPASFQGTKISAASGRPNLPNIKNADMTTKQQRQQLDLLQAMNQDLLGDAKVHQEIEGVIESYELAFRMQTTVPEVMDFQDEPKHILERYGVGNKDTDRFAKQCLMARRFAEAGVRFIELTHNGWDLHNGLRQRLGRNAKQIDQPIGALMADLKERGMFEDTLIVWGGEFGRTSQGQNSDGRAHNNRGFTVWMAGGGVKGGTRYGETDEHGGTAVNNKVHTHDLHATLLHMLGLDHERLTYKYAGRDFRLTDVYGNVAKGVLG